MFGVEIKLGEEVVTNYFGKIIIARLDFHTENIFMFHDSFTIYTS